MSSHDLAGLIRYLKQDDWDHRFGRVLEDHLQPLFELDDLGLDELDELIGPGTAMTLWGCAFEDFLTRNDEGGRNFVEVYLKRRGWSELPRHRAYMTALRASMMSLYEVSDIVPGTSMMVRDLLRKGEPVLVHEVSATKALQPWDRIAVRLVPLERETVLAGGLLAYSMEACEALADAMRKALRRRRGKSQFPRLDTETLQPLAPLFTQAWVTQELLDAEGAQDLTQLINHDDEELVFHDIRYPLAKGVTQSTVAKALDAWPELRAAGPSFWNWLRFGADGGKPRRGSGFSMSSEMADGVPVLGTVELAGRKLRLQVNSEQRAARGQAMLAAALGDLVGMPLAQIMTPEQLLAEHAAHPGPSGHREPSGLSPEEELQFLSEALHRHYQQILDEEIPALGDQTPRQAARTAGGRRQLVEWLKYLENGTANAGRMQAAMAAYDFGWMWTELGIADLRK